MAKIEYDKKILWLLESPLIKYSIEANPSKIQETSKYGTEKYNKNIESKLDKIK